LCHGPRQTSHPENAQTPDGPRPAERNPHPNGRTARGAANCVNQNWRKKSGFLRSIGHVRHAWWASSSCRVSGKAFPKKKWRQTTADSPCLFQVFPALQSLPNAAFFFKKNRFLTRPTVRASLATVESGSELIWHRLAGEVKAQVAVGCAACRLLRPKWAPPRIRPWHRATGQKAPYAAPLAHYRRGRNQRSRDPVAPRWAWPA